MGSRNPIRLRDGEVANQSYAVFYLQGRVSARYGGRTSGNGGQSASGEDGQKRQAGMQGDGEPEATHNRFSWIISPKPYQFFPSNIRISIYFASVPASRARASGRRDLQPRHSHRRPPLSFQPPPSPLWTRPRCRQVHRRVIVPL
ncbi:hypothetical protein SCHPADRAFT_507647 [Schizopora paradoxa]|uniref:Uncharacterized protein n=1 Tax=Schizopora paradoxa TaxID=27342 RepID=A0A0H2RFS7_9AGAM|nr:hypothetical protein SCHPADRAFT_507647 [Schizopora paradoxa]